MPPKKEPQLDGRRDRRARRTGSSRALRWPGVRGDDRPAPRPALYDHRRAAEILVVSAGAGRAGADGQRRRVAARRHRSVSPGRDGKPRPQAIAAGRQANLAPPRDLRSDRPAADAGGNRRVSARRLAGSVRRVVNRLLESPAYGQRWGRHWLDTVRYADSSDSRLASAKTIDIGEAWRYRDWVVDAFNRDMPYDQFISNRNNSPAICCRPEMPAVNRRRHHRHRNAVHRPLGRRRSGQGKDDDRHRRRSDRSGRPHVSRSDAWPALGATIKIRSDSHGRLLRPGRHLFQQPRRARSRATRRADTPRLHIPLVAAAEVEKYNRHVKQIADLEQLIKTKGETARVVGGRRAAQSHAAAAASRWPTAARKGACPIACTPAFTIRHILIRGSYTRLGEIVPRHFPIILTGPSSSRRSCMAAAAWNWPAGSPVRRIRSTARVMVNRIWQHHFGQGIVRTPRQFRQARPTADASRVARLSGRRIRRVGLVDQSHASSNHALGRLSAVVASDARERSELDRENRYFSRMNRRRLEAEALRDNAAVGHRRIGPAAGRASHARFQQPAAHALSIDLPLQPEHVPRAVRRRRFVGDRRHADRIDRRPAGVVHAEQSVRAPARQESRRPRKFTPRRRPSPQDDAAKDRRAYTNCCSPGRRRPRSARSAWPRSAPQAGKPIARCCSVRTSSFTSID